MNYAEYFEEMQSLLVLTDNEGTTNLTTIIPRMIEYAETRCYNDLDFLGTMGAATGTLVSGNPEVPLPTTIDLIQSANVITPIATAPNLGTRNTLQRSSIEFINYAYPSASLTGVPQYYALYDDSTIVLAPAPDAAYTIECLGPLTTTALSPTNTTTYLTLEQPQLFVAASMVFGAGWLQNYGSANVADNAGMATSWEAQYGALKATIGTTEDRRKARSVGWTAYTPSPTANAPRAP